MTQPLSSPPPSFYAALLLRELAEANNMIHGLKTHCRSIESGDQAFIHELNADPVVRAHVVVWDASSSTNKQITATR